MFVPYTFSSVHPEKGYRIWSDWSRSEGCSVPQTNFLEPAVPLRAYFSTLDSCAVGLGINGLSSVEMGFTTEVSPNTKPNDGKCSWLQEFTIECNVNFHSNKNISGSLIFILQMVCKPKGPYFRLQVQMMNLQKYPLVSLYRWQDWNTLSFNTMFEDMQVINMKI